jgi:hypothetical protein
MAEWLKAHAWKACVRETVPWVRIPLSPPFLRRSSPQYPIVRVYRNFTEEFRDFALIPRANCSFFAVGSEDGSSAAALFSVYLIFLIDSKSNE